ncbi:Ornithine aminotransferase [Cyphellophora attinorum]|uniref:Ornithine aminotransferase n=1 Tax=Cyphellophora attinorum TaxID=1664694 RepID=A0A0N1H8Y0_9EURO|nr:Ornithine aminotransferase [Phialophora attinorum]KPI39776.1 Ornithine aminotransferase [Phialophora attinorum]
MSPIAIDETNGHANGTVSKSAPTTSPAQTSKYHASTSDEAIHAEHTYAAHNYHPLPIVFAKALGTKVWDPEGREYLDFLSAYSAVNQATATPNFSRAFYNDVFPRFAQFVTEYFNFDVVLPMNTGAEAVETAIKIARKWGYKSKAIPANKALVLSVAENFHGRTFSAISMSTDPESRDNYGPFLPAIGSVCPATGKPIPFNDVPAVRAAFETHGKEIAAFIVEPIQGEAGIVVPDDNYLRDIRALCDEHNILLICDEIQTGIARTGKLLCHEWAGIKPDMVLLGKAISGGMYPPGTHGSTYGGNPLGCAVAMRALEIVQEEGLTDRAQRLGEVFRKGLEDLKSPMITTIRGKGLLNAIVIDEARTGGHSAWDLCMLMKEKGLLAKPTHENIIRLAPPLVITEEEIKKALSIIDEAVRELPTLKGKKEDEVIPDGEKDVKIGIEN